MSNFTIDDISGFGDVSAEDDAVLEYFLETDDLKKIQGSNKFLVLGRKGAGKTAIVRYFTERVQKDTLSRALNLRGYPWNIHASRKDSGASEMESYVASWRYVIAVELAALVLDSIGPQHTEQGTKLRQFLQDNYGGSDPSLQSLLQPNKIKLQQASFEPSVLGIKLGSVDFARPEKIGLELNALTDSILDEVGSIVSINNLKPAYIHFDELDRGLKELDENRSSMLIGLVLAAREVRIGFDKIKSPIHPIVYLRSDLWAQLRFSDKNKISQSAAVHLEWDSDKLRALVDLRLQRQLGKGADWDSIDDGDKMRGSQTKWSHIIDRTFLRPRDVIAYLNDALRQAKQRREQPRQFTNRDIVEARTRYSAYLKQELDDEISGHLDEWEDVLQVFSTIQTQTFSFEDFEDEYKARELNKEKDAREALHIMYDFSVIGYQVRSGYGGSGWVFQYSNPESQWDRSATRFKVHPGLKEFARLKEERSN